MLPSLKPPVTQLLRSRVVYKITYPNCEASYVGQTIRHLTTRFHEHVTRKGPVKEHIKLCECKLGEDCVKILGSSHKGDLSLQTLEALWIRELRPEINTKDEWRSRELSIKF